MNSTPKPAYVMTEPHLSGHRVVLGYETAEDAYAAHAMLSAAPSPVDEDEVERVARALYGKRPQQRFDHEDKKDWVYVSYDEADQGWRDLALSQARAAISAMRPALKLTEEDRARVEEIRAQTSVDADLILKGAMPSQKNRIEAHEHRAFLLSLIDKLTEAG